MASDTIKLFLAGDVMTGRGVDQILPSPGSPKLREGYIRDARDYVALAEAANGPIPRPANHDWPWGDALKIIGEAVPDVRVVNLETSITADGEFAPDKGIHYRMHPDNIACLTVAGIDVCVPVRSRRMRLERAAEDDAAWLHRVLRDASSSYGTTIAAAGDGTMTVVAP